jgi:DNA (cytosine-5)-methyltransferase 1
VLRVLSLFSGAGGLDIGFEKTGYFETVACVDSEPDCTATLRRNKNLGHVGGHHSYLRSARIIEADLSAPENLLPELHNGKVDVVIGGPPCQAFSVLGKRRGAMDDRGSLVFSYVDALEHFSPTGFVMENVPGFMTVDGGRTFHSVLRRIDALGYRHWHGKLCAADYGDATIRMRFFLIGVRAPHGPPVAPPATHCLQDDQLFLQLPSSRSTTSVTKNSRVLRPYVTVSEALADLQEPCFESPRMNAHVAVRHQPETVERFAHLKPGERDKARRRNRLRSDAPALTLFAGGIKGKMQARTHIHPERPRELTPRECARLHSFSDDWEFCGAMDSVLTQVSNSVPIELAAAVARALRGAYPR